MTAVRWNARIIDGPDSEPWAEVGELLLAVRTPRSRDFVTVEVGLLASSRWVSHPASSVVCAAAPPPWMAERWSGEVAVGQSVQFSLGENEYELTLAKLEEAAQGLPWIVGEFVLELR